MNFENNNILNVYLTLNLKKIPMGRLGLRSQRIFFEYDTDFLKTGINPSPFKLPPKPGIIECEDRVFDGLFGIFNDSLPDGWGRLLLDRKLRLSNINPGDLSPLDRLRYVGEMGMGALSYEPNVEYHHPHNHEDFDAIAGEIKSFQETDDAQFVDHLFSMNGSSSGARPKIALSINGEEWIVKFRSPLDPKDIGPIEYAYNLMAKQAKLEVPEAKLFPSKKSPGYFGVKRFDYLGRKRLHMHTISGLLHLDHHIPNLDYKAIMKVTHLLTKNVNDSHKQFRATAFNILAHNRDDHSKNFSFLMDESGSWKVSPAYDLTFSSGPAGEHCTTLMGEGKYPNISHLLQLAEYSLIPKLHATQIIEEVALAISNWQHHASDTGVTKESTALIGTTLKK